MPERGDDGSTLLLVPSAVLVLFLLTALAVDGAATFLAQRELADACVSAANDAAGLALEPGHLYGADGAVGHAIDPVRSDEIARSRVTALEARWRQPVAVEATTTGPRVVLRLRGSAPLPVGPGGASRTRAAITATCEAITVRR